jgi:outer membrane lipoprotein SlyB
MIGWTDEDDSAVTVKRLMSDSAVGIALAALAACGPDYSPNTYSSTAVQQANKVEPGVIVGVRRIDIAAQGTTGTVAGAAAGGIAGAAVPESGGVGSALTALGGGLVGGLVGNTVDRKINDTFGYEYIVRETKGDLVSVTQKDEAPLAIGLHVLVIAGTQARIVVDYTVPIEPAKPATPEKTVDKTAAKTEPPAAASPAPPAGAVSAAKIDPAASMPSVEIMPLSAAPAGPDGAPSTDKPAPPAHEAPPPPAEAKSDNAPSDAAPAVDPPPPDPALR